MSMTLNEYQKAAAATNITPGSGDVLSVAFMDKVLGLVGESGEVADHVKKILRDDDAKLTPAKRESLVKELGDILWYVALLAQQLDVSLEEVAKLNVKKQQSRKDRGQLQGSGDNR